MVRSMKGSHSTCGRKEGQEQMHSHCSLAFYARREALAAPTPPLSRTMLRPQPPLTVPSLHPGTPSSGRSGEAELLYEHLILASSFCLAQAGCPWELPQERGGATSVGFQ